MTILPSGAAPWPDATGPSAWRLAIALDFITGPETRALTLRRTATGWDLALDDYEARVSDAEVDHVRGFSIAWTAPEEFWRWVGLIADHDVDGDDVVALMRRSEDPALARLADELHEARGTTPPR